ncbi:MAG: RloB domain-containing protein [Ardenticatenales bacterium]|nr:RloB domain-containing protein [Ardenticatenales bacterium]
MCKNPVFGLFSVESKVHVEILTREETASSPRHILDQINQWMAQYQIGENDEFWLVIDVDRWKDAKLSRIAQECVQKSIRLGISNPAIELWFLLHLTAPDFDAKTRQAFLENGKRSGRTRLDRAIIEIAGSYNKSNLKADDYLPYVTEAIQRARLLDVNPEDRWPQQLGTRVYLLAQSIIDSASYGHK